MTEDKLGEALRYIDLGWAVIPLHTPTEAGCSCHKPDCGSLGKHPRTLHGLKDASLDPEQIRRWWGMWPDANIGIATGAQAGIIVLDVDGEAGNGSLTGRPMPPTPTARTGNGSHWLFRHPGGTIRNFNKRLDGLDLRADGGYIVAPPSRHANGRCYEWVIPPWDVAVADCPEWLAELLSSPTAEPAARAAADGRIPAGQRNSTLSSLAGAMRRYGMTEREILAALTVVNEGRCIPCLDAVEVARIAKSIAQYEPAVDPRGPEQQSPANGLLQKLLEATMSLRLIEPEEPDWIVPQFAHRKGITLVAGLPGVGKTTFAVELSYALATCDTFLADRVGPAKVLWLSFEHAPGSIREKHDALGEWNNDRIVILDEPAILSQETGPTYVEYFQVAGIDLVIVDTLLDWLALPDVDKTAPTRQAMEILHHVCEKSGIAIVALGHPTKGVSLDSVYAFANSYQFVAKSDVVSILMDVVASDVPGGHSNLEYAELRVKKLRHGEGPWTAMLLKEHDRFKPITKGTRPLTISDRILAYLYEHGGLVYSQDLCDALKEYGSDRRIARKADRLTERGIICKAHDRGNKNRVVYHLPDAEFVQP